MMITLIIIALAGAPGEEPERLDRRLVVSSISECQALMAGQIDEIMISRPDVQSISATCLWTDGGLAL